MEAFLLLQEQLDLFLATPAILDLADNHARVFYAAAAFGTGREVPDIAFDQELSPCQFPLHSRRETIGLLAVSWPVYRMIVKKRR